MQTTDVQKPKSKGVSKQFLRQKVVEGHAKIVEFFKANEHGRKGMVDIIKLVDSTRGKLFSLLDQIEGDRILYREDLDLFCETLDTGNREIRHELRVTDGHKGLRKPFSSAVLTMRQDVCTMIERECELLPKPAAEPEPATGGTNKKNSAQTGENAQDIFSIFEGNKELGETFYLEQMKIAVSKWTVDFIKQAKASGFIHENEIISRENFRLISNFFTVVTKKLWDVEHFIHQAVEKDEPCSFEAFKEYWAEALGSITEAEILAGSKKFFHQERLLDFLMQTLVKLTTFVKSLERNIFENLKNGETNHDLQRPETFLMPEKTSYINNDAVSPPQMTKSEKRLMTRCLENGDQYSAVAEELNNIFHGGLAIRDAAFVEEKVLGKSFGGNGGHVLDSSRDSMIEFHKGLLDTVAHQVVGASVKHLLDQFKQISGEEIIDGTAVVFVRKDESDDLAKLGQQLKSRISKFFNRYRVLCGQQQKIQELLTARKQELLDDLRADITEFYYESDLFKAFYPEEELPSLLRAEFDAQPFLSPAEESDSAQETDLNIKNLVLSALLGERYASDFAKPLLPQEKNLLARYVKEADLSGKNLEEVISNLTGAGKIDDWTHTINAALHCGYPVRIPEHLIPEVRAIVAERFADKEEQKRHDETVAFDERFNLLRGRVTAVLEWIDESKILTSRKKKSPIYDMVEVYVGVLRAVDFVAVHFPCPIDIIEHQILFLLERIKRNYENEKMRRRLDDEDGEFKEDPKRPLGISLQQADFIDALENGPNRKVESAASDPAVERFSHVLRSLDDRITACRQELERIDLLLQELSQKRETKTQKEHEFGKLNESLRDYQGKRNDNVLRMRTLLMEPDYSNDEMDKLIGDSRVIKGQIEHLEACIESLKKEIQTLDASIKTIEVACAPKEDLNRKLELFSGQKKNLLDQLDGLLTPLKI